MEFLCFFRLILVNIGYNPEFYFSIFNNIFSLQFLADLSLRSHENGLTDLDEIL